MAKLCKIVHRPPNSAAPCSRNGASSSRFPPIVGWNRAILEVVEGPLSTLKGASSAVPCMARELLTFVVDGEAGEAP